MSNIFILYLLSFVVVLSVVVKWRAWPAEPTKMHAPKVSSALLPRALVHAGEAGFQRIDPRGQPLKRRQQLPVVGVQLLKHGQVVGVEALAGGEHISAELRPADRLRLGWLGAGELLHEEERRSDCADDRRPALSREGARRGDLGLKVCAHSDLRLVFCPLRFAAWVIKSGFLRFRLAGFRYWRLRSRATARADVPGTGGLNFEP